MHLENIDHVVFTVADIDITCTFYSWVLGMEVVTFDAGRKALHFGPCQINLHQLGKEFEPKATHPAPGSQDICLIVSTPMVDIVNELRTAGVDIIEGPVPRTGARGAMESVYVRDPDGNLVEIARYCSD